MPWPVACNPTLGLAKKVTGQVTVTTDTYRRLSFRLYRPDGDKQDDRTITEWGLLGNKLDRPGRWVLVVEAQAGGAPDVTVTLYLVHDRIRPLATGTPTTVRVDQRGREDYLTFHAVTGQNVVVDFSDVSLTGQVLTTFVPPGEKESRLRPDDVRQTATLSKRISETGTWQLRLQPEGDATGSFDVRATTPQDRQVTATLGTPLTVTYPGRGVGTEIAFTGVPGRRLTVTSSDLRTSAEEDGSVSATLVGPAGQRFAVGSFDQAAFGDSDVALPTGGTWTLLMARSTERVGTQTVSLRLITDRTATATRGTPVVAEVSVPGQNIDYAVAVEAGRTVQVVVDQPELNAATATWSSFTVDLYRPDGVFAARLIDADPFDDLWFGEYSDVRTVKGTYTVRVDFFSDTVGSVRMLVKYPRVTRSALASGGTASLNLGPGDVHRFAVQARAGQSLALVFGRLIAQGDHGLDVSVIRPDGTIALRSFLTGRDLVQAEALDQSGTWLVELKPFAATSFQVTVTAYVVQDRQASMTPGAPFTVAIHSPGQTVRYPFRAEKGQRITLGGERGTWISPIFGRTSWASASLEGPDGTVISLWDSYAGDFGTFFAETPPLAQSGTWTLVVRSGGFVGAQTFTLRRLLDQRGTLELGQPKTLSLAYPAAAPS